MVNRALLVAIDAYAAPYTSRANINDLYDLKNILETLGYTVETSIDANATKSDTLQKLNILTSGITQNDHIVFAFFGHGSRVSNPNEPDGTAECLCMYDWSSGGLLWDYEVDNVFKNVPCNFELVFGSCFSGGIAENTLGVVWMACRENEYSVSGLTIYGTYRGVFPFYLCSVIRNNPSLNRWQTYIKTSKLVTSTVSNQHCEILGHPNALWHENPFNRR